MVLRNELDLALTKTRGKAPRAIQQEGNLSIIFRSWELYHRKPIFGLISPTTIRELRGGLHVLSWPKKRVEAPVRILHRFSGRSRETWTENSFP